MRLLAVSLNIRKPRSFIQKWRARRTRKVRGRTETIPSSEIALTKFPNHCESKCRSLKPNVRRWISSAKKKMSFYEAKRSSAVGKLVKMSKIAPWRFPNQWSSKISNAKTPRKPKSPALNQHQTSMRQTSMQCLEAKMMEELEYLAMKSIEENCREKISQSSRVKIIAEEDLWKIHFVRVRARLCECWRVCCRHPWHGDW